MPDAHIRAVTFDVGRTVLFPHPSLGVVYARVAARHDVTIDPCEAEERFIEAWRGVQQGHDGLLYGTTDGQARAFWLRIVGEVLARDGVPVATQVRVTDALYEEFAQPHAWRAAPDWDIALRRCRDAGVGVGLISNWDVRLRGLLDAMAMSAQVDVAVISAEVGVEKPDAGIFVRALQQLGTAPEETLHVGDTWLDDVAGAAAVGMRPVWLNPEGHEPPRNNGFAFEQIRALQDLSPML